MNVEYEILETFNTSIGLIAMIRFAKKEFPGIGSEIYYNEQKYSIAGTTLFYQPIDLNNDKVVVMRKEGIWDCLLKPL